MDKYIINDHEIEFDTWDQINLELFESERKRAMDRMEELKEELTEENAVASLRTICETVRDFLDTVVGEGTSRKVFGERMNAVREAAAMMKFTSDVSENLSHPQINIPDAMQTRNRQQRREQERAIEREKRRMEAAARVVAKKVATNIETSVAANNAL